MPTQPTTSISVAIKADASSIKSVSNSTDIKYSSIREGFILGNNKSKSQKLKRKKHDERQRKRQESDNWLQHSLKNRVWNVAEQNDVDPEHTQETPEYSYNEEDNNSSTKESPTDSVDIIINGDCLSNHQGK